MIENPLSVTSTRIDYSYITNCTDDDRKPGVTCYQSSKISEWRKKRYCRALEYWCRSDRIKSCVVNANGGKIATNDKNLCGNNALWRYIPTGYYVGNYKFLNGRRCNGTLQHQINPWYLSAKKAGYDQNLKETCEDFSDQIHTVGAPCPNLTHFMIMHAYYIYLEEYLDYEEYEYADEFAKEDAKEYKYDWALQEYFSGFNLSPLYDPHSCQQSCAVQEPGCIACTNKDYFRCGNSGICIHPRLRCDGHPQCPGNEDEDYLMCMDRDTYIKNGHVAPFASFRCKSKIYPEIDTVATRCNTVIECHEDVDEKDCSESTHTKNILVAAICLALGIFLGIKLPQVVRFIRLDKQIAIEETEEDKQNFDRIIQNLRENPENKIACQNINVFLLHILNTKKTSVVKKTYVKFYDSLVEIYENDLSKMFVFLKAHIDPAVTTDIVEHRYRGLKTKIINFLEMKVIRYKMITHCTNKVTEKTVLRLTFSSLTCLVGLLSHILDTIKDTLLALTLLNIIGGISSIIEFPTYFTTAVVLSLMGTIIVPILLSSAHLAITQPFLVFNSARLRAWRWGRVVAGLGCLILSPLNTVVLKTRYEMTKQEAIKAARDQGDNTIALYEECDKIQAHILEHVQNEIGILIPKL